MVLRNEFVAVPDECDGLQVFPAAMDIGDPLAFGPGVIKIEHAGHRIHAQPVDMVDLQPEERAGQEEIGHLRPAEVEDGGVPVLVKPLPGIGMLIEMGAVKITKAMLVAGKMGRHPVE